MKNATLTLDFLQTNAYNKDGTKNSNNGNAVKKDSNDTLRYLYTSEVEMLLQNRTESIWHILSNSKYLNLINFEYFA